MKESWRIGLLVGEVALDNVTIQKRSPVDALGGWLDQETESHSYPGGGIFGAPPLRINRTRSRGQLTYEVASEGVIAILKNAHQVEVFYSNGLVMGFPLHQVTAWARLRPSTLSEVVAKWADVVWNTSKLGFQAGKTSRWRDLGSFLKRVTKDFE